LSRNKNIFLSRKTKNFAQPNKSNYYLPVLTNQYINKSYSTGSMLWGNRITKLINDVYFREFPKIFCLEKHKIKTSEA